MGEAMPRTITESPSLSVIRLSWAWIEEGMGSWVWDGAGSVCNRTLRTSNGLPHTIPRTPLMYPAIKSLELSAMRDLVKQKGRGRGGKEGGKGVVVLWWCREEATRSLGRRRKKGKGSVGEFPRLHGISVPGDLPLYKHDLCASCTSCCVRCVG